MDGGVQRMKKMKIVIVLIIFVVALTATGCQWNVTNLGSQPVIRSAQLTESEQNLLNAVGVERTFALNNKKQRGSMVS